MLIKCDFGAPVKSKLNQVKLAEDNNIISRLLMLLSRSGGNCENASLMEKSLVNDILMEYLESIDV